MSNSYGFDDVNEITKVPDILDISGLENLPPPTLTPEEDAKVIEVGKSMGFSSREPVPRSIPLPPLLPSMEAVTRKRNKGPLSQMNISGPTSVLNEFKALTNDKSYDSYWEMLAELMKNYKQ